MLGYSHASLAKLLSFCTFTLRSNCPRSLVQVLWSLFFFYILHCFKQLYIKLFCIFNASKKHLLFSLLSRFTETVCLCVDGLMIYRWTPSQFVLIEKILIILEREDEHLAQMYSFLKTGKSSPPKFCFNS